MRHGTRMLLLLVLVLMAAAAATTLAHLFGEKILYRAEVDDVVLLNVTDFKRTIFGKDNAWVVQFYNSWCGHCVLFAPTYIELAHKVKVWHSVIRMAAINCADIENLPTCREFEATKFPTLKFFQVNATEGDLGETREFIKTVPTIQNTMVDFLMSNGSNSSPPCPRLDSIRYPDMNSVWQDSHVLQNHTHVALLVHGDMYLPKFVILDLSSLVNYIAVFNVESAKSELVTSLEDQNITDSSLVIIDRDGHKWIFSDCGDNRQCYMKHVEDFVKDNIDSDASIVAPAPNVDVTVEVEPVSSPSGPTENDVDNDRVYLQDLENVIYYILHQEVALEKFISHNKLDALENFLDILVKYLPVKQDMVIFLSRLQSWLSSQSSVPFKDLEAKITELQESLSMKLGMKKWMGCRGSNRHFRGYPCGLWTTFHTLTVNAFLQRGKDADYDQLEVTTAIRKYVISFFGCRHCARHFSEMSANLSNEIRSPDDSVLWLWQGHNKVNARIKGVLSEDPAHPKKQFPMTDLCGDCRSDGVIDEDGNANSTIQWDLKEVLAFLVRHYSGKRIVGWETVVASRQQTEPTIDVRLVDDADGSSGGVIRGRDLMKYGSQKIEERLGEPQSVFSKWSVGRADISICVVLYLSSILLLLLCYVFVLSRKKWSLLAVIRKKRMGFV